MVLRTLSFQIINFKTNQFFRANLDIIPAYFHIKVDCLLIGTPSPMNAFGSNQIIVSRTSFSSDGIFDRFRVSDSWVC